MVSDEFKRYNGLLLVLYGERLWVHEDIVTAADSPTLQSPTRPYYVQVKARMKERMKIS